jgi:hypothetical protein
LPLHEHGTGFVTPPAPVSEQLEPESAWQKISLLHPHGLPTRLGEQKPPAPQSSSTRQLLSVAQVFGAVPELDDRQAQGVPAVQSESLEQAS